MPAQLGLQWQICVPHATSHALARRVRRSRGFAGAPCRQQQIKEASMSVHVVDTFAAKARSLKPRRRSAGEICASPCASCAHTWGLQGPWETLKPQMLSSRTCDPCKIVNFRVRKNPDCRVKVALRFPDTLQHILSSLLQGWSCC